MTPAKIITWHDEQAAFWTFGREGWRAARDGWEPPDCDGVGTGPYGIGSTEQEAIADLLDQEIEA